jgi:Flp pilus assembly protein TadB
MEATVAKAQSQLERIALIALGWLLMLVGILGLFLPIVPGALLIVAGALMLSPRTVWLQRAEKCRTRFPVLDRAFTRSPLGATGGRAVPGTVRIILDRDRQFESLG